MAKKEIEAPVKAVKQRAKPAQVEAAPAWAQALVAQVQQLSQEVSTLKQGAHVPEHVPTPEVSEASGPEETAITAAEMDSLLAGVHRAAELSFEIEPTAIPETKPDSEPTPISDADVSVLLAEAEEATFSIKPDIAQLISNEPIEPVLLLAEQIPQIEIAANEIEDSEVTALLDAGQASKGRPDQAGTIVSADEIAALLDPTVYTPAQAPRMSDDEIARLLADANVLNAEEASQAPATPDNPQEFSAFDTPPQAHTPTAIKTPIHASQTVFEPMTPTHFINQDPPTVRLEVPTPDLDAIALVPAQFATRALALPLRIEGEDLVCLVAQPFDQSALNDLARVVGKSIRPEPGTVLQVVKGLRAAYAAEQEAGAKQAVYAALPSKPNLWVKITGLLRRAA